VDEDKLFALRGDVLRNFNRRGYLRAIFAHLMSIRRIADVATRQLKAGVYSSAPTNVGKVQSDVA
jgi:hypothetical protein